METTLELSYTKIQTYLRCPYLYELVFNQDWRVGPTGSQAFGNSIHRALAAFLDPNNKELDENRLLEFLDFEWVNEGYASTEEILDSYHRARKLLQLFFKNHTGGHTFETEKNFVVELGPVRLRGTVDRIDKNLDGTHTLIEYKTHAEAWPQDRVDNDLQGTIYDWGIQEGLGYKPLKLKYYFLSPATWVSTTRTSKQRDDVRKLVLDVAEKIQNKNFEPDHRYCDRCGFKTRCPRAKK